MEDPCAVEDEKGSLTNDPSSASPTTTPASAIPFPTTVTNFTGVSVTLENNSVWKQFYSCGTEMILTKQGRRMFPYCRYRLAGLDPECQYSLVLSIVPSDKYRYRWSTSKWEVTGPAEHQAQGLIRAFSHHYSPCKGSEWMGGLVSFYKLKLTNNPQDQEGHIVLHSMHRYIPRLHCDTCPRWESMTFTFPQTEFMAVTTYQNFRITQLKINHNPFAKGFREDGNNPRLNRVTTVTTEAKPVVKTNTPSSVLKQNESKEGAVDLMVTFFYVFTSDFVTHYDKLLSCAGPKTGTSGSTGRKPRHQCNP
uniref:T-box domain-containing protein n=1 Tax=Lates calcarifer TaxID=8187 RepID=A0A4W6DPT6_LATCA